MAVANLKNQTVAQLLALRADIDEMLLARRSELEGHLAAIGGGKGKRGSLKGSKVAAKYQDADGNQWAGRGAQPRWLVAALKEGKSLEEFLIAKPKRTSAKRK
jgi:DNA-binding protein H-NS